MSAHEKFRALRLKLALSQVDMARLIRCSQARVFQLEAGGRTPGIAIALRIESLSRRNGMPISVRAWVSADKSQLAVADQPANDNAEAGA